MRVLVLSPYPDPLMRVIEAHGDKGVVFNERLDAESLRQFAPDFVVSYGYRHILRPDVLGVLPDRFINLHISMLPWNRGSEPNFWSFLEGTPKGVSIHYVDEGLDTGDLIAQKEVSFPHGETLSGSYALLQETVCGLFAETWPSIRAFSCQRTPQKGAGSLHRLKDREPHNSLLSKGWDTPVSVLEDYGRRHGLFKSRAACDNVPVTKKGS
ncbi:MAG: formyltransferase family protein [Rhodospirillales bacterium]|nr:formyltransferase family protein [Rhodospirillales bacterium]MCW8861729.1 formyltransferase family protein [Rhodospirillales bacterium]MCW9002440.1 formyltransferase family protein [Rhodospirillales bacterium]MCW9039642.1 formyltransferase family protein [Rhodospirillales bacterium]